MSETSSWDARHDALPRDTAGADDTVPRWAEALILVWLGFVTLAPTLGPDPRAFLHGDSVLYGAVAKSTLAHGDWLALRLGDTPYFNKPPLLFWLAMGMFRLFGASTWTAQLVGVASGILLLLATWAFVSRLADRRHGLLAALSLGTTYVFLRNASVLRVDAWLALTVLGALWAIMASERRPSRLPLFWCCVAVGVLFKGPAGLLPVPVLVLWSLLRRRVWPFDRAAFWVTLPLVPLLVLPWVLHNWQLHGENFVSAYWSDIDITISGAQYDPSYQKYGTDLIREGWPWLPFLLHGCWLAARACWRGVRDDRVTLPIAWITGVMIVLLSMSGAYSRYVIPLLPASSFLTATSLLSIWPRLAGRRLVLSLGCLLLLGTAVLAFAPIDVNGDRMPDIVRFDPLIREHGVVERLPVLGSRVSVNLVSSAVFYDDLQVEALPEEELQARLHDAGQPLLALRPHRMLTIPPELVIEVLATGSEHDLVLLRWRPDAATR